ncbi:MAG: NAD(P)/FAD-dependent oxidoreductase, partial [Myxococcota bacterium]
MVVGAGHNGLTAAAYLARAGVSTLVLERRPLVGGACVTEELWPGCRISRAAYVAGLLRPAVVRELELARHGLRLLPRNPSSYTPLPDGRGLLLGPDAELCRREIARFSERDAERYPAYEALLGRVARTLEPLLDSPPPDPGRLHARDLVLLGRVAAGVFGWRKQLPAALALLLGPARRTLESWFESEPLRGTLATDAVIGAWAAPSSPGTGYVLFHHVMGETHGARGVWAYVEGGMGRLSEALASSARSAGASIRCEAPVEHLRVEDGRVCGVVLADGEEIDADVVLSNADPRRTFQGLVPSGSLPPEFEAEIETLDFRSPVVKINAVLDGLPRFRGAGEGPGPEHVGT